MEKVLLIVNAYAGSVSRRTKEVIAKALSADFKLEVEETASRTHATELARDAVDRGFDAVLAFGGDGTINEAAQSLVGTNVALGILPGGTTNVAARALGVPRDPVEATAFVADHLRTGTRRRVNVGRAGERYFLFSVGFGLDAAVVKRVDSDPEQKRRRREWFFVSSALRIAMRDYRGADPKITLRIGEEEHRVVLAIFCNGRPYTYFKRFPVDAVPGARLDGGIDVMALQKIRTGTIPRIVWGIFVSRGHQRWRTTVYRHDLLAASIHGDEPLPVQVDGDYIGDWEGAEISLVPNALELLV